MKASSLILIILLLVSNLFGNVIRVSLDGLLDCTSIQQAIDLSVNTDTVLVYPGRYIENINYNGKSILIASLESIGGNQAYIDSTVIDGNQESACVLVTNNHQNACLRGFTITNGRGYLPFGEKSIGGGICITESNLSIKNCNITLNCAGYGGGIFSRSSNLSIEGTTIAKNNGFISGGGIHFNLSGNIIFSQSNRCSIFDNNAGNGTDVYYYEQPNGWIVHLYLNTFTVFNPSQYYAGYYSDYDPGHNPFVFHIQQQCYNLVPYDLFVSPSGDDNNNGLSSAFPLKIIAYALRIIDADSLHQRSIHLAEGNYQYNIEMQPFPLSCKAFVNIEGNDRTTTVLQGSYPSAVIYAEPKRNRVTISNLTVRNPLGMGLYISKCDKFTLANLKVIDCHIGDSGIAAIYMGGSTNFTISDCSISDNSSSSSYPSGLLIYVSGGLVVGSTFRNNVCTDNLYGDSNVIYAEGRGQVTFNRCQFIDNISYTNSGANVLSCLQIGPNELCNYYIYNCLFSNNISVGNNNVNMIFPLYAGTEAIIENCSFVNNSSSYIGGTVAVIGNTKIKNSVFYSNDTTTEVYCCSYADNPALTTISYCDIEGGLSGVTIPQGVQINWGEGNIDMNPLWQNSGNTPYYLSPISPLIDSGSPDSTSMGFGLYDLAGNERIWDGNNDSIARIDIGAYEFQPIFSPENLTATVGINSVTLNWTMQTNRALLGYRVYRDSIAIVDIFNPAIMEYTDTAFTQSDTLTYYLVALYGSIESPASNQVTVYLEYVHNVDDILPSICSLSVFPNPFSNIATISYSVEQRSKSTKRYNSKSKYINPVSIVVFNTKGQKIKTLIKASEFSNEQIAQWDGKDEIGKQCSNGVYLIKVMQNNTLVSSKKITLIQ